jgi:quercetin dioxygenase-like cupin family protein
MKIISRASSVVFILTFATVLFGFGEGRCGEPLGQTATSITERKTVKGPSTTFTGDVWVEVLFRQNDGIPALDTTLAFMPGARTFWHAHPYGQQILVTYGVGLVGTWDGAVQEIAAGDVIHCPPGVKHWNGASPYSIMSHVVVVGTVAGVNHEWLEEVSDEHYHHIGQ